MRDMNALVVAHLDEVRNRLHAYTIESDEDSCWLWVGPVNRIGYGQIRPIAGSGVRQFAHRLMYLAYCGPIPDQHIIRHTCDNPPCVNPTHLLVGLPRDNSRDMSLRGRCASKITGQQAQDIYQRALKGEPQAEIARLFGISRESVSDIAVGRTWRHFTGAAAREQ